MSADNIKINENFKAMKESYLFSEIGRRVREFCAVNPDKKDKIIRLGIGDVTLPLTKTVINALHAAVDEMANGATFRGYAPEYGYDFVRETVAEHYKKFGVTLGAGEIFASDGAKSDLGNIVDIFGDNEIFIPDPVYPVYLDSNLMSGRAAKFLPASAENGFLPMPSIISERTSGIIYLCSPNNPTGAVYSREQLGEWVKYANETESVIIFDSAYEAYIHGDYPRSIYEIEGARTCAIEMCSLSKSAGFTGTRFAWTVIPDALERGGVKLAKLWARRQATKFNGVPYIIQRAAEAALSREGQEEAAKTVAYYMENAQVLASMLRDEGIWFTGGVCSPYIWLKCPHGMDSWEFFDYLLQNFYIVGTPGEGFGEGGKGYFRLTAFGTHEATIEAAARLRGRI